MYFNEQNPTLTAQMIAVLGTVNIHFKIKFEATQKHLSSAQYLQSMLLGLER